MTLAELQVNVLEKARLLLLSDERVNKRIFLPLQLMNEAILGVPGVLTLSKSRMPLFPENSPQSFCGKRKDVPPRDSPHALKVVRSLIIITDDK